MFTGSHKISQGTKPCPATRPNRCSPLLARRMRHSPITANLPRADWSNFNWSRAGLWPDSRFAFLRRLMLRRKSRSVLEPESLSDHRLRDLGFLDGRGLTPRDPLRD